MRKTFWILALTVMMANIKVKGYTLITEPEVLTDEYLAMEDAEITGGTVNWDKKGHYTVTYRDKKTQASFKHNIIVAGGDDLASGYELKTTYNRINLEKRVCLYDVLFIKEDEYFIYGAVELNSFPYNPIYTEDFFYVAYYREGSLIWENIMYPERYGCFTSACLVPNGIALIGDYDSYSEGRNIVICIFNYQGGLACRREIHGSGNDFAHKIFYDNGIIRFVGSANSRNQDYSFRQRNDYDIICGFWKLSEDEFRLNAFGNSGDDVFYDAALIEGVIGVNMEFVGTGSFQHNENTCFSGLITVSPDLILQEFRVPAEPLKYCPMYSNNNYFIIVENKYLQSCVELYYYDNNLKYQKNYRLILPEETQLYDIRMLFSSDTVLFYATGTVSGQDCLILNIFNNTFYKLVNKIFYTEDSRYIFGLYQNESGEIVFANMDENKNILEICGYIEIKKQEFITDVKKLIIYSNEIYLNGKHLASYQTVTDTVKGELAPYGLYVNLVRHHGGAYVLYFPVKFFYRAQFNVKNRETYDVGYSLFFNGEGYLNNELIKIGYAINQPGNYLLEIVGNNDERSVVVFAVDYLSERESDWTKPDYAFNLSIDYIPNQSEIKLVPKVDLLKQNEKKGDSAAEVYIYATAGLVGLLTGGLIPMKKRGIKNV